MPENAVAQPFAQHEKMSPWWSLVADVRGGTSEVRAKGKAYLPPEPMEDPGAYKRRVAKATFAPWYRRLVRGLVGMILRKPIAVVGDVSGEMEVHLSDLNLEGDDLQEVARQAFISAIDHAYAGIFVDYPPQDESIRSRADEVSAGLRPYWVIYHAPEIIGYKEQRVGGAKLLTQLRILETATEDVGEFGERSVEQIRVYSRDKGGVTWRIFRKDEDDKSSTKDQWILHAGPAPMSLPYIPFAFVYTDKRQRCNVQPPMLEIAYLNVKHYQLSSDLDHALHLTMHPKLALFGYDDEHDVLGTADEALVFTDPNGSAEWIVCDVQSLEFGQSRVEDIEKQMGVLGLSALVTQKNVGESAEAKRLDRNQGDSIMAVVAQGLQNALDQALEFHADYLKVTAPTCQVSRDFDLQQITPQMLQVFLAAVAQGRLSTMTFHELLKRGEVGLDDEWTPEQEAERIAAEYAGETQVIEASIEDEL